VNTKFSVFSVKVRYTVTLKKMTLRVDLIRRRLLCIWIFNSAKMAAVRIFWSSSNTKDIRHCVL